jgi:hypothetical protein
VLLTEELYLEHLRQYVRNHPRLNGYGACRRCQREGTLVSRGPVATNYVRQYYKFQCKACGGWEQKPKP